MTDLITPNTDTLATLKGADLGLQLLDTGKALAKQLHPAKRVVDDARLGLRDLRVAKAKGCDRAIVFEAVKDAENVLTQATQALGKLQELGFTYHGGAGSTNAATRKAMTDAKKLVKDADPSLERAANGFRRLVTLAESVEVLGREALDLLDDSTPEADTPAVDGLARLLAL